MNKILLVEDDKSFGYVLSEYLMLKAYSVIWKESAKEAMESLNSTSLDLVILDINLKQDSGYAIAKAIIDQRLNTPFIFLTARDMKIDQLKGYKLGAEEYVTKPIDEEILLAKIEVILTRKAPIESRLKELTFDTIRLNCTGRVLHCGEAFFQLTERECLLMECFLAHPQSLVERNYILLKLWESKDEFSRNSMDVYISRLRRYLASGNAIIRNVHGKGFVFELVDD